MSDPAQFPHLVQLQLTGVLSALLSLLITLTVYTTLFIDSRQQQENI